MLKNPKEEREVSHRDVVDIGSKKSQMESLQDQPESMKMLVKILQGGDEYPNNLEITILPIDDSRELSYPLDCFMEIEGNLGLHAPTLPLLARDFRRDYYKLRKTHPAAERWNGIEQNLNPILSRRMMDATLCVLIVCPDNSTAWADRRRILQNNVSEHNLTSTFQKEILFLNMLFSQHSKAPNSWIHRKWICRRLIDQCQNIHVNQQRWDFLFGWAKDEIVICKNIAERYPKNYYAWTHRNFVLLSIVKQWDMNKQQCDKVNSLKYVQIQINQLFKEEISSVETWLSSHISDHSAAHYGGQVMMEFLHYHKNNNIVDNGECTNSIQTSSLLYLADQAIRNSRHLVTSYPSHEVLWIWKRICSTIFVQIVSWELSKITNENDNKKRAIINQYIDNFVVSNIKIEVDNAISSANCTVSEFEKNNIYSLTYTMWTLREIKRSKFSANFNQFCDLNEIEKTVSQKLASNNFIVYNTWRIHR